MREIDKMKKMQEQESKFGNTIIELNNNGNSTTLINPIFNAPVNIIFLSEKKDTEIKRHSLIKDFSHFTPIALLVKFFKYFFTC